MATAKIEAIMARKPSDVGAIVIVSVIEGTVDFSNNLEQVRNGETILNIGNGFEITAAGKPIRSISSGTFVINIYNIGRIDVDDLFKFTNVKPQPQLQ